MVVAVPDADTYTLQTGGPAVVPGHGYQVGETYYTGNGAFQLREDLLEGDIAQTAFVVLDDSTLLLRFEANAYEVNDLQVGLPDLAPAAPSVLVYDASGTPSYLGRDAVGGSPDGHFIYSGNNPRQVSPESGKTYVFQVDADGWSQFADLNLNLSAVTAGEFVRLSFVMLDGIDSVALTSSSRLFHAGWGLTGADGDTLVIRRSTTLEFHAFNDNAYVVVGDLGHDAAAAAPSGGSDYGDPDVVDLLRDRYFTATYAANQSAYNAQRANHDAAFVRYGGSASSATLAPPGAGNVGFEYTVVFTERSGTFGVDGGDVLFFQGDLTQFVTLARGERLTVVCVPDASVAGG